MATNLQYIDQLKFNSSPTSNTLILDNIFTKSDKIDRICNEILRW